MRTMGRFARTAIAAAVLAGVMSARSDADALEALPSSVTAFVYVKDVAELNSHISAMATASELTELSKDLADPLAFFKTQMPRNGAGIRDSGDFTVAFVDSAEPKVDESMLVLVPITDFDAFVTNFEGENGAAPTKGENGIVSVSSKGNKLFIAKWGDYAAVGHTEKTVATPEKTGLSLDDWTKKQIDSNDVTAVMLTAEMYRIDPNRADKIIKQLNKLSGMATQMSGGMMPASGGEMVNEKMSRAVIERFIADAEVGVMGMSFSEKGIRFNARTLFKTGTYLANTMMKAKPPGELPISRVPDDTYMAYGAMAYDSDVAVQVIDDFMKKMGNDLNATGDPMAGPTAAQIGEIRNLVASSRSAHFAAKTWAMSEDKKLLQPSFMMIEGDGAKLKTSMVALMKSSNPSEEVQAQDGMNEGDKGNDDVPARNRSNAPQVEVKLKENARTVGGVSFDQVDVEMKGMPMAGLASSTTFFGATPNGLFAYRDLSDEAVTNATAAAGAGSITQSEGYKLVSAELPKNRYAEFYLQPEQAAAGMGTMVTQMFGIKVDLTPPTGLPPIGVAFACEDRVFSAEMVVPSKSIAGTSRFVQDSIKKVMGGGGGGNGEQGEPADEDL